MRRRKVNAARNSLKFYELWAQFFIFYDFCERLFIRESSTLSNFIAKTPTTFKDLQKKFQISITLRFLIVPLRRGSFKGHLPLTCSPLFPISIPIPIPFLIPLRTCNWDHRVRSGILVLVFKTGTNYSKLLLTFFRTDISFYSSLYPPIPLSIQWSFTRTPNALVSDSEISLGQLKCCKNIKITRGRRKGPVREFPHTRVPSPEGLWPPLVSPWSSLRMQLFLCELPINWQTVPFQPDESLLTLT